MKNIFITIFFLLFTQSIFSQPPSTAKLGYLITNNNDTIWGKIQLVHNAGYFMKIKIFNEKNWDGKVYKADKIKSFYCDSTYFKSLIWKDVHYFFERIVNGSTSLYAVNYNDVKFLPVPGVVIPVGMKRYDEYFIVDSSSIISVKVMGFRNFMLNYVKTCPALVEKIDKKELKFDDLKQIIEEYNLCTQ